MKQTKSQIEPNFYTVKYDKADDDKEKKNRKISSITIVYTKFVKYLMDLGFNRYDKDGQSYIVKITKNIVEEVSQTDIVDAVEENLSQWKEYLPSEKYPIRTDALLNKLYGSIKTYFAPSILHRLRPVDTINFLEDTKDSSYFFYGNGIVEVTKDNIKLIDYEKLEDKKIWRNQMLKRDFEPLQLKQFKSTPFAKFVYNIASRHYDNGEKRIEEERFKTLQCIIGYCLHGYFEGKLKASIFTDSTISEEANGRTGKTLLVKGMGKILNVDNVAKTYTEINGKDFDQSDKNKYQECGLDTKLIHINDARKNIDFESFFNDITEGVKVKKLYIDPFIINCKIIISTNRTIRVKGGSARDRCIEFEMSNHYSDRHSPEKEFNHWFFRDWNTQTWNEFDNFMLYCVQLYLKNGLIKPSEINLRKRKFIENTSRQFFDYMNDIKIIVDGSKHDTKEVLRDFKQYYPEWENMQQRRFNKWMKDEFSSYSDEWKVIIKPSSSKQNFHFSRKSAT